MDIVDKQTRSRMMAAIRGRDTHPELVLRKRLHAAGFRFRLHRRDLPGRPDVVLPRYRAAVLVHGCFWHRHANCRFAAVPASNASFWSSKFAANVERDARNIAALCKLGWRVAIVWECALRGANAQQSICDLQDWFGSQSTFFETKAVHFPPDPANSPL